MKRLLCTLLLSLPAFAAQCPSTALTPMRRDMTVEYFKGGDLVTVQLHFQYTRREIWTTDPNKASLYAAGTYTLIKGKTAITGQLQEEIINCDSLGLPYFSQAVFLTDLEDSVATTFPAGRDIGKMPGFSDAHMLMFKPNGHNTTVWDNGQKEPDTFRVDDHVLFKTDDVLTGDGTITPGSLTKEVAQARQDIFKAHQAALAKKPKAAPVPPELGAGIQSGWACYNTATGETTPCGEVSYAPSPPAPTADTDPEVPKAPFLRRIAPNVFQLTCGDGHETTFHDEPGTAGVGAAPCSDYDDKGWIPHDN